MLNESMSCVKAFLLACTLFFLCGEAWAQDAVTAGRKTFEARCSVCHGADGNGGEMGPAIARRIANLTDAQLRTTILEGLPSRGMPANDVGSDLPALTTFLRSLRP